MDHSTKNLKEAAMDFLRLAASGKVAEAYRLYTAEDFRHHNPWFKGDRKSLMEGMEKSAAENPDKVFEIQRALQDGNMVAVHSYIRQNPADPGAGVVHIFRFSGSRIAELWDLGQAVPVDMVNENGMF